MEIKLSYPFEKDGKKLESLSLDLMKLSGHDIVSAEQEARMRGDASPNPLFSSQGLAIIAGRASGLIVDDILALKAPDYLLITNEVSNFLYGWMLAVPAASEKSH